MTEERFDSRETSLRQQLLWTQLFKAFWVALDPKKLLLAGAGIVVMAFGWWLLALVFSTRARPDYPSAFPESAYQPAAGEETTPKQKAWDAFKRARNSWNLFNEAAGVSPTVELTDAGDLASTPEEFERIQARIDRDKLEGRPGRFEVDGKIYEIKYKRHGTLNTWPWSEDRGPNPFLIVTGRAGVETPTGSATFFPWEKGHFFDWFLGAQVPVLIEPLVKFLRPVAYFLHPNATFVDQLYFLLVICWTVATWAVFGGAITRIAAVQVARNEKIGMMESLRYVLARWQSYVFASFAPLIGVAIFIVILMLFFGIPNWIPIFAEFWMAIFYPVVFVLGLVIAFLLVGLVGWPMIHTTLSAEGSDAFDALSRSYSYVLQRPWNYLWYAFIALLYGAVVVFFVGLMGSLAVYLGKWGVSHTPATQYFNRDPSYMFVYAPKSFGWRDLLLQGSPVINSTSDVATQQEVQNYIKTFNKWNYIGAFFVAVWLHIIFLVVVGVGYSYFWASSTIIYLLMRKKVDDTEMDEVYLEEEPEGSYTPPPPPPPPASTTGNVQMVEAPALLKPTPPPPPAPPAASEGTGSTGTTPPASSGSGPTT